MFAADVRVTAGLSAGCPGGAGSRWLGSNYGWAMSSVWKNLRIMTADWRIGDWADGCRWN